MICFEEGDFIEICIGSRVCGRSYHINISHARAPYSQLFFYSLSCDLISVIPISAVPTE